MQKNIKELLNYHDLIAAIVTALEARDPYTSHHSMRVAEMTEALCKYMALSDEDTTLYHISAHLHDVGKIGIEDVILRKEGKLDDKEWEKMKSHTRIGYEILHTVSSFEQIAVIVKSHHERWDGKGYPDGLYETAIPLGARIIAVADSIDAMLSDRPYRKGMDENICHSEIIKNSGIMYDKNVVKAAVDNWDKLIEARKRACCELSHDTTHTTL